MKKPKISLLFQICMVHMVSHIHILTLPALMPIMSLKEGGIGFVKIGFAISVFNIVSAVVQAPMGFFVDKLGPKRVLMSGLLIGSLSFFSLGFIDNYIWLVFAMGIAGIANAVYHPADYALLSQNTKESRIGRSFSLHTFAGYVGGAVTPILMLFFSNLAGTNVAFMVSGIIGFMGVLLLYSVNDTKPVQIEDVKTAKPVNMVKTKLPIVTPAILLMLFLFCLLSLSGSSLQNFSVSAYVMQYNMSLESANMALTAFLITSSVGVLAGGQLADYTKHHGLVAAGALVLTAILALLIYYTQFSSITLIIISAVMGFLSGLIAPSRDILVRNVSPKGAEGRVFGIVSTGFNIGGTIGPILFAWVIDHRDPREIFLCAAIFMTLTAIIATYQEVKGTKRVN